MNLGNAGRATRHRRALRYKDIEKGHYNSRRRRRMYNGGETCARAEQQAAFLSAIAFLFPDYG